MQTNEYQELAKQFAPPNLSTKEAMILAALGIAGESGEFVDLIKKIQYHGCECNLEHLKRELGDICWYIALAATTLNFSLEEVLQTNINKLSARYPQGFNYYDANNMRKDDI